MQAGSAVERGLVVRAVFEARKNVSHTLKEASPHLLSSFSEIREKVEVWLTDTRRGRARAGGSLQAGCQPGLHGEF